MPDFFSGTVFSVTGANEAYRRVLADILAAPNVSAVTTGADRVQNATSEALGYTFIMDNPRARIVATEPFKLPLAVAVARFVWMISGNNRLADIAFYEPKVRAFSDDGAIVPGSSYGLRIRQAIPGIDQLRGVIDRLKSDNNSRRAALSIYQPSDTTRDSRDIPCAFGMFFHIREGRLHTQVVMRSNNATVLLPFNIFEFSMLAELVAAECQVEMGPLKHYAASMHIYEHMRELSESIVSDDGKNPEISMDTMPPGPSPLDEVRKLIEFESEMRHGSTSITDTTIEEWTDKVSAELCPYWRQFAYLLLATVANRNCSRMGIEALQAVMKPEFRDIVKWVDAASANGGAIGDTPVLDLFRDEKIVLLHETGLGRSFRNIANDYEREVGERLGADELLDLQGRVVSKLAARGLEEPITIDYFREELGSMRSEQ